MSESADPAGEFPTTLWERRKLEAMSRIQRVALDLFDQHGYRNVTVERVATEAGVSASSIYRYFGTKEMLVLYDESDPRVLEVLRTAGGDVPIEPAALIVLARQVVPGVIEALLTEDAERRMRRQQHYVATIPEIRAGQTAQMRTMSEQFGAVFAHRTGRGENDLSVRMAAAYAVWGGVAALDHWAADDFRGRLADIYATAVGAIIDAIEVLFR